MITYDYFKPPSILSPRSLVDVLDLYCNSLTKYAPIIHTKPYGTCHVFPDLEGIYHLHPELEVLNKVFTKSDFNGNQKLMPSLLTLHPDLDTILQIQEFVTELGTNDDLYDRITSLIESQNMFYDSSIGEQGQVGTFISLSPEKVQKYLAFILNLKETGAESKSMKSLFAWAQQVLDNNLYKQVWNEKKLAQKSRIIAVAEPEFGDGLRYGLLKPGVNIINFVDFFSPRVDKFVDEKASLGSKKKVQHYIKYKNNFAKAADKTIVLSSAQNLKAVNNKTIELLATSLFSSIVQLQHALAGANFYRYLKKEKYPLTFPEINTSTPYHLEMKSMFPIRMLLNYMNPNPNNKLFLKEIGKYVAPQSVDFNLKNQIIELEGPNNVGKTEFLRTVFLASHNANSGWPVPAEKYITSLFPGIHFFKFKKPPGVSGSELRKDFRCLMDELSHTYNRDLIIIDEFGDATNNDTTNELALRLFPKLLSRENALLITTHQGKLKDIVRGLGGEVYVPSESSSAPYQPISTFDKIDYKPSKVLDKIGATSEFIGEKLSSERPKKTKSTYFAPNNNAVADDIPF